MGSSPRPLAASWATAVGHVATTNSAHTSGAFVHRKRPSNKREGTLADGFFMVPRAYYLGPERAISLFPRIRYGRFAHRCTRHVIPSPPWSNFPDEPEHYRRPEQAFACYLMLEQF